MMNKSAFRKNLIYGLGALWILSLCELTAQRCLAELLYEIPTPNTTTDYDFGESIAVSGQTAIIGTSGARISLYSWYPGAAYVFDLATGQQLRRLGAAVGGESGMWVAIDGNRAVVGSEDEDDRGAAYLYDVTTGQQLYKLTAPNAAIDDKFGTSVAIQNDRVLVGARTYDKSGFATLFDATTGSPLRTLAPTDNPKWAEFGYSVAIDGSYALIGAPQDPQAGSESGSAYIFDINTGQQLRKLTAPRCNRRSVFRRIGRYRRKPGRCSRNGRRCLFLRYCLRRTASSHRRSRTAGRHGYLRRHVFWPLRHDDCASWQQSADRRT